jgi:peptide/nickel transport system permease protein
MTRYLLGRAAQSVLAVFGVMAIVFVVMRLSGDPTLLLVPEGATREQVDALRAQLGFDRPIPVQFADYLWTLCRLDLGESVVQRLPVWRIVAERIPYTGWLASTALAISVGIGIPVGVATAVWRGTLVERALMPLVLVGQSMPTFWSGILLIMFFGVGLGWLPTSGADEWRSVVMPAIALGGLSMATFARITRTSVMEELGKDYVRAIRAKGVARPVVVLRHVLRNGAIPIVTIAALEIANLLAGAVIVETVFAWPGMGQLAVQSIQARDFMVVQAIVLLVSIAYVLLNFVADILYGAIDPRIRLRGGPR